MNRKLIGLTGTNGAGKGEAAAFFKEKGFDYFSLSDIIREELKKKGKKITRDSMIKMGNQIREKNGPDALAKMVQKKIQRKSVIDSIRNPKEIEFFRRQKNFILLAIDAPVELRYERAVKRGREESAGSLEGFIAKESEEITSMEKAQQLQTCIKMADFNIINDGSLEDFRNKLEKFL